MLPPVFCPFFFIDQVLLIPPSFCLLRIASTVYSRPHPLIQTIRALTLQQKHRDLWTTTALSRERRYGVYRIFERRQHQNAFIVVLRSSHF